MSCGLQGIRGSLFSELIRTLRAHRNRKEVSELAARNIYIATSTWKYKGWMGQLYTPDRYSYRGKVARRRFEARCLQEYSEVFKTVCVDAGFDRFTSRC